MGYEHLIITPETESDEVTESNAKNLLPISSECEVTLEDKRDCEVPVSTIDVCDNHFDIISDSKINDDISVYDDDFEDIEYVEVSLSDPEIVNQEEENCQPMARNIDFSCFDKIQTPQYPEIHLPYQEISDDVFQADHSGQNKESLENSSTEIGVSNSNEERKEHHKTQIFIS
uniref:Uncharacterized protein n=1 Tax=Tanacetum cinerariifolium TaxID=118510 RepID=A0A699Q6B3_TANCI|nr:hypothetical protein [Tanacetum cinerariifolium]